jgi:hypothetical protein
MRSDFFQAWRALRAIPLVSAVVIAAGEDFRALLERHLLGEWGEVTEEEQMLNDLAVEQRELIRSIYRLSTGTEIYVTTEEDRESTIIELPDEAT